MKKWGEKVKKNKGITLIALVITIIVLLILAGVSISTLTGQNGILTQAQNSKEQTRAAEVEELVELWKTEKDMSDYNDMAVKSDTVLLQELLDSKKIYEDEIDRNAKTITIAGRVISYKTASKLTDIFVALYDDGTLVFSNNEDDIDTSRVVENGNYGNIKGKHYEYVYTDEEPWYDTTKMPPWFENRESITKVSFLEEVVPNCTAYWFDSCSGLTSIDLNGLDTSNVTDMSYMFGGCSGLTSIDLNGLDTGNVTYMSCVFGGCSGLTSIDLNGLDTSNVTDMSGMFGGCSGLTNINLAVLDTSNVTSMRDMFFDCTLLTNINLAGINTSNVTSMYRMFMRCSSLESIDASQFDTSNVTSMDMMFIKCSSLTELDLSTWDTGEVTGVMQMLENVTANVYIGEKWNANITEARTKYSKSFIFKTSNSD